MSKYEWGPSVAEWLVLSTLKGYEQLTFSQLTELIAKGCWCIDKMLPDLEFDFKNVSGGSLQGMILKLHMKGLVRTNKPLTMGLNQLGKWARIVIVLTLEGELWHSVLIQDSRVRQFADTLSSKGLIKAAP